MMGIAINTHSRNYDSVCAQFARNYVRTKADVPLIYLVQMLDDIVS